MLLPIQGRMNSCKIDIPDYPKLPNLEINPETGMVIVLVIDPAWWERFSKLTHYRGFLWYVLLFEGTPPLKEIIHAAPTVIPAEKINCPRFLKHYKSLRLWQL